jgi:hypothetical protein
MRIDLDPRLTDARDLSVVGLVRLWRDHTPAGLPTPEHCPRCGYSYLTGPLCPTAALVRPMLRARRHLITGWIAQLLTYQQTCDLNDRHPITERAFAAQRRHTPATPTTSDQLDLFGGQR